MPKYRITDTQLCYVTWEYEVEAENEEEAWDAHANGEANEIEGSPSIGDSSSLFDGTVSVTEMTKEGEEEAVIEGMIKLI